METVGSGWAILGNITLVGGFSFTGNEIDVVTQHASSPRVTVSPGVVAIVP